MYINAKYKVLGEIYFMMQSYQVSDGGIISIEIISVDEFSVDGMFCRRSVWVIGEMTIGEMTVGEMSVDQMSVGEMSKYHFTAVLFLFDTV